MAAPVDVAVVGAGPGGLSAALYLARFRRSVLVIDDGRSRARRIPWSHNCPGFDGGVAGARLVDAMHAQASVHGAAFAQGHVDSIERFDGGFELRWAGGTVRACSVVIATGASDVEPDMPDLTAALREGALRYCPVCDGYEVIDRAVAVIASGPHGASEAVYLRHFTPDVSLYFTTTAPMLSDTQWRALTDAGVVAPAGALSRVALRGDRIEIVHRETRSRFDSVYCALGMHVHSRLATELGAECDADSYLLIDSHHRTTVPGLYAVGDVALGLNQISVATGGAAIAASAIHLALNEKLAAKSAG